MTVLKDQGLSSAQIAYVENTIQKYDSENVPTTTSPTIATASGFPANTGIWSTYGNHTGQFVILYEGAQPGVGWVHMQYRHNWKNTAAAQNAVRTAINSGNFVPQTSRKNNLYFRWFHTTVPFFNWKLEMKVVVQMGNATGNVNAKGYGPGAVSTAYPYGAGNYVNKTWHGQANTSIVP